MICGYRMKWYYFLVYFSLWCSALGLLVLGVSNLTGYALSLALGRDTMQAIYAYYPGLHMLTTGLGFFQLVGAAMYLLSAIALLRFWRRAPFLLIWTMLLPQLTAVGYVLAASRIFGVGFFDLFPGGILTFLISGLEILLNWVYFRKRRALFDGRRHRRRRPAAQEVSSWDSSLSAGVRPQDPLEPHGLGGV